MGSSAAGKKNKDKKRMNWKTKEALTGYLFISPYLILFIIFTLIPFISAFALSFLNIKFISRLENLQFVGIANFIRMFQDKEVMAALGRSGLYTLIYVPLIMVLGFTLAYILNKSVYLKRINRSMMFMPYVSNMVAVGVVFSVLLGLNGPLKGVYQALEIQPLLLNLKLALPTVVVIAVWKGMGLNIVTYLGALQGVNQELIEAAQIDGATKWQQIKSVIIPSISPTTFFLLISSIITSLQNYTVIQALTEGKPGQSTTTMALSIVRTAFVKHETSYASAQALVVFAIVMIFTLIQWRGQKKWVNY